MFYEKLEKIEVSEIIGFQINFLMKAKKSRIQNEEIFFLN
jgi:hypothetical protein